MSLRSDKPPNDSIRNSDEYKLVIYRSEDFQEVRSFNLTLGNIYVLTSVIVLTLCGLLFSLVAFTPLKRLVPGYGELESNQQFLELVDGVDDLTYKIEAQGTYVAALRTLLGTGLADPNIGSLPLLSVKDATAKATIPDQSLNNVLTETLVDQGKSVNPVITDEDLFEVFTRSKVLRPVTGLVSSEFDPNIKHYGIDILAPAETPIISMMDGIVFSSGWDLETGYTIGIQHADNILSFYKHNSQLLKEKGTFVRAGEVVAIIGNTGTMSSGPHLHFEIWHGGKPINPQDILNFD